MRADALHRRQVFGKPPSNTRHSSEAVPRLKTHAEHRTPLPLSDRLRRSQSSPGHAQRRSGNDRAPASGRRRF